MNFLVRPTRIELVAYSLGGCFGLRGDSVASIQSNGRICFMSKDEKVRKEYHSDGGISIYDGMLAFRKTSAI